MEKKRRTEIAELGEFGLIDLLTRGFDPADASTLRAAGDDAAVVMPPSGEAVLCSTDALLEGIETLLAEAGFELLEIVTGIAGENTFTSDDVLFVRARRGAGR